MFTRSINRASRAPWHVGVVAVLLGLFAGARGLQAQSVPQVVGNCFECEVIQYPDPPCLIDSCIWAHHYGWADCSQFGGCGDIDTCLASGHGCSSALAILLDGRSVAGLSATQVHTILAEAGPEELAKLVWSTDGDTEYLKLSCNGTVIHAEYSPAEAARLRLRTHRLTI